MRVLTRRMSHFSWLTSLLWHRQCSGWWQIMMIYQIRCWLLSGIIIRMDHGSMKMMLKMWGKVNGNSQAASLETQTTGIWDTLGVAYWRIFSEFCPWAENNIHESHVPVHAAGQIYPHGVAPFLRRLQFLSIIWNLKIHYQVLLPLFWARKIRFSPYHAISLR